ncbi:MAG: hypothetical protein P8Z80_07465 [Pseudolabrys sp.]
MVLFTDGWSAAKARYDSHQRYDQRALLAGIVKGDSRLDGETPAADFRKLLAMAKTAPQGPIYVELTAEAVRAAVEETDATVPANENAPANAEAIDDARALLNAAKHPVIIVGLEARRTDVVRALEAPCVSRADLIVFVGFDPVELIGKPWQYTSKVLDLGPVGYESHYVTPHAACRGDLAAGLSALAAPATPSAWTRAEISRLKADMTERLAAYGDTREGLSPVDVIKTVQEIARPFKPPRSTTCARSLPTQ